MFGGAVREDDLWQDREIRFDSHPSTLDLRKGELEIDQINSVEDTKGNNGTFVVPEVGTAVEEAPAFTRRTWNADGN